MLKVTAAHLLMIISAFCWTLAYLLIIRRSWKDKAYGMPVVACAANLAWEFYYSVVNPFPPPQLYANIIWLIIDIGIFGQVLVYAKKDFPGTSSVILNSLIIAAVPIAYLAISFSDDSNLMAVSSAYAQNFMMSALFISLLIRRGNMSGQSIYIGILKAMGTLLISVMLYFINEAFHHLQIMTFLYAGTLLLDVTYVLLLYDRIRKQGHNPWYRL